MKLYEYQFGADNPVLYVSDVETVHKTEDCVLLEYKDSEMDCHVSFMLHNCNYCRYDYYMKPMFCFSKLSDEQIDKVKRYIVREG